VKLGSYNHGMMCIGLGRRDGNDPRMNTLAYAG
jgi:hypothetical protein